ncbi:hypothetical protein DRE_04607 [Drechslerella stenobrocha 248]|uniref:Glutamate carboxypeptidase n=1 Tax=Drechslerella stenobrocha 248 TaxID=1043628 RepID=W7HSK5_9PEZI|nr:hypothetical protein DRE_04607 [Drechslerella stenobrocha 248]
MSEEKEAFRLRERLALPPGYEEATAGSSRASDVSDNDDEPHENQRLLFSSDGAHDDAAAVAGPSTGSTVLSRLRNAASSTRPDGYQPPTVQSVRSSFDSNSSFLASSSSSSSDSGDGDGRRSTESLRRILEVMDVEEPEQDGRSSRIRERISKPFSIIGGAISSLGSRVGSRFGWFTSRLPSMPSLPSYLSFPSDEDGVINLQRFVGVVIVVIIVYAIFATDLFTLRMNQGHQYDPDSVKRYLIDNIDPDNIKHMLKYLSSFDHLAGTEGDYQMAQYVAGKFKEAGMRDIRTEEYEVYLNYPSKDGTGRHVSIVNPSQMRFEAKLEEEHFDTTKNSGKITPAFHGYSKSGNVTGHLVYANYGSRQDFAYLKAKGVDVKGAVVLVRYFGTESDAAVKVKEAESAGAAGCIIYSDPKENGNVRGAVWPEGRWAADDYVQRASVGRTRYQPGDPLTPGVPSTPKSKRIPKDHAILSKIPSLPLAWRDAQQLIKALKGHGSEVEDSWKGGIPAVEWWTGDKNGPQVNLVNMLVEHDKQKIWNILSTFEGYEQPRKAIIIGSRRDSWAYGASAMTGTAIMLEIMRVFGQMYDIGWRPARTIHFASWDGGQYGEVGSTEWVEQYANELRMDGVAYINVGTAVSGPEFTAKGSPALQLALNTALGWFLDPSTNTTMLERFGGHPLAGPAINTDSLAFTNFAGMASIDIGFETKDGNQALPLHSAYDSYDWMTKFGDPKWEFVPLLAQIWGVLTIVMSDNLVIPLNYLDYANALGRHVDELERWVDGKRDKRHTDAKNTIDWQPMKDTIKKLQDRSSRFNEFVTQLENTLLQLDGAEPASLTVERLEHNNKLALFETHMLDMSAVPGREWFKSTIFAPQVRSELDHLWFPSIVDAVEAGNWDRARFQLERVRQIIDNASAWIAK